MPQTGCVWRKFLHCPNHCQAHNAGDTVGIQAPKLFRVRFETSQGPVVITAHRDSAPGGADRFYYLVRNGFFDGERFFRVRAGFIAQFGLNGDPAVIAAASGLASRV